MSFPTSANILGVSVAFDDDTLVENPLWYRLDTDSYVHLQGWSINRGRASEMDTTGTGTATATFIDRNGTFDPTNSSSPFFGKMDPMRQAAIALYNPVTSSWSTVFRGFVSEWLCEMDITAQYPTVTLELVDGFDVLSSLRLVPGTHGHTAPSNSQGDVYYEGEPGGAQKHVDRRIHDVLDDCDWPTGLRDIFSGNVTVREKVYDRGDCALSVIKDAADAEFPSVSNIFMTKTGSFAFRGRFARFNPTNPSYDMNTYNVGFQAQVTGSTAVVPISSFAWRRSEADIINASTVTWFGMPDTIIDDMTVEAPASIASFGYRSDPIDDLLTYQGHDDDGNTTSTPTELQKFATYRVNNYDTPTTRLTTIGFRPRGASSANATVLWEFLCSVELSDRLSVVTTHAGGGGFNDYYFVEGIRYDVDIEGGSAFTNVTLELDVSPDAFWSSNPFGSVDGSLPTAILSGSGTLSAVAA